MTHALFSQAKETTHRLRQTSGLVAYSISPPWRRWRRRRRDERRAILNGTWRSRAPDVYRCCQVCWRNLIEVDRKLWGTLCCCRRSARNWRWCKRRCLSGWVGSRGCWQAVLDGRSRLASGMRARACVCVCVGGSIRGVRNVLESIG